VERVSGLVASTPQNVPVRSPEFSVLGVEGLQLEFFPNGRTTSTEGFCALFLWCPRGVQIRYQLQVGKHRAAPDFEEFADTMGHGHSNFCHLETQRDKDTDAVVIAVDIMDFTRVEEPEKGLLLTTSTLEAMVAREAEVLHHRDMGVVEWRVRDVLRRIKEVPPGFALCSPLFSAAGISCAVLELYPNGANGEQSKPPKDGYCGLYLRCAGGAVLTLTLFVGSVRKGPFKTDFNKGRESSGIVAKGLPAFCRLEDQVLHGENDVIVGVVVANSLLDEGAVNSTLVL